MSQRHHRLLLWLPEHDNQPVHWQVVDGDPPGITTRGTWPSVADMVAQFGHTEAGQEPLAQLNTLVLVPATQVTLHTLEVQGRITPAVKRSLPWRLEDELIDDVDNLHIALLGHENDQARLAVTSRVNMMRWQQWLNDAGVRSSHWLPGTLLLPTGRQEAYQLAIDSHVMVRCGQWQTMTGDVAWQPQLLDTIATDYPELTVVDLGTIEQFDNLSGWQEPLPNLLQGEWRPASPMRSHWLRWRPTAILSVLFLALFVGNSLYTTWQLEQQVKDNQQAARQVFTTLFPNERVVVLRTQMAQKIASLQPAEEDESSLLVLLATIAPVLETFPKLRADSLNYDGNELNIQARAADFDTFNRLRSELEQLEPVSVNIEALERDKDEVTGSLVISAKEA